MKTVTLIGKQWPLRYSLRAAIAVGERFGSLKKAFFDDEIDEGEQLRRRINVLLEMLRAGKAWAEKEEGAHLPELPEEEDLLDSLSYRQGKVITETMLEVINEDDASEFGAEGDGKNAEAR